MFQDQVTHVRMLSQISTFRYGGRRDEGAGVDDIIYSFCFDHETGQLFGVVFVHGLRVCEG